jgi:hypothetical protein
MADWGNAALSGLSGAGTGAEIGNVIPGIGTATGAVVGGLIGAGGSLLGGAMSKPKETPNQQRQSQLLDQLLSSLNGSGPYADLFSPNMDTFNKGFADPMRSKFTNQTAPAIQQSFIASGQQRNSGMQNHLTQAGVDMDQMINQAYMQYQQQGNANRMNAMNAILGAPAGVPQMSGWESAKQGLGGYLGSEGARKSIQGITQGLQGYFQGPNPAAALKDEYQSEEPGWVGNKNVEMGVQS